MNTTPSSQLLLVEGPDELHVVNKLLNRYDIQPSFEINPKGGFDELHSSIFNEVNVPQRRVLGILADANDHPERRWQSISDQLRHADCEVPEDRSITGTIFAGPRGTRVGVWLMPDNQHRGELEDFVAGMIPEGDPIWPRARGYIDDIPDGERKFPPGKLTRAYVHAWLATRRDPRPMGLAITAGDLLHDAPIAASFVDWLRNLFTVEVANGG